MSLVMQLDGVLFFPVTPFDSEGNIAYDVLAEHVKHGVSAGPGAVFAACGTGEFHALGLEEFERVVAVAVEATAGKVPVFAGAGGSVVATKQFVQAAERAGANGILLLPPYLVTNPAAGLVRYVAEVAGVTELPIIVYQRNNARFTPETAVEVAQIPNVVGFKDGIGDLDQMQRIVLSVRANVDKPFQFFNGLPTAEMTQLAYRGIGVELYSSAVFCFAPEISIGFYNAVQSGDTVLVNRFLYEFYKPLVELRDKVPGYAVALVKAAVRANGLEVGGVRPPLIDPLDEHLAALDKIIAAGKALLS